MPRTSERRACGARSDQGAPRRVAPPGTAGTQGTLCVARGTACLESRFGWKISVPQPSADSHFQLKGVRRCAVMDGRVAHIIYSWLGEPLSVYVLPKQTLGDSAQFVHRFRHNSIMWSKNDRTYIIVTTHRRDPALEQMVAYVKATAY